MTTIGDITAMREPSKQVSHRLPLPCPNSIAEDEAGFKPVPPNLKLYQATHHHEDGEDFYLFWCDHLPSADEVIAAGHAIDFDADDPFESLDIEPVGPATVIRSK